MEIGDVVIVAESSQHAIKGDLGVVSGPGDENLIGDAVFPIKFHYRRKGLKMQIDEDPPAKWMPANLLKKLEPLSILEKHVYLRLYNAYRGIFFENPDTQDKVRRTFSRLVTKGYVSVENKKPNRVWTSIYRDNNKELF